MKKPIEEIARVALLSPPNISVERLEKVVHISKTTREYVHALRGVSTGDIDLVITDDIISNDDESTIVAIVSHKTGKYDGARRHRILIRRLPSHQVLETPYGVLTEQLNGNKLTLTLAVDGVVLWSHEYRCFDHVLHDPVAAGAIPRWHWRRYYNFLPEQDVVSYCSGFGDRVVALELDLSAANRLASRELYRMSRAAGYRKLTLREQKRYGLSGQWHTDRSVAEAHNKRLGARSGCGERTLLASSMASHIEE